MITAKLKKRTSHKPSIAAKMPTAHTPVQPRSMLAEHVYRIGVLGKRIDAYIEFMSQMGEHPGLSDEMKTRAAIAFYEKLLVVEQQLGRIHDEYRLE